MKILDDLKLQYQMGGVAQKLIFWNVGFFVISYGVFGLLGLFGFPINILYYVSLSSHPADLLWKPWSIISYAFFHAGILHILFNMLILNFCSSLFTTYFTQKQLLNLYFVGGIFAGIIYIISYFIFPALQDFNSSLVGASGAIMAVLFAAATFSPFTEVRLLLIGTVKLWHIALVLIIIDLVQLPLENTGGHLAHLGGALFGYLYIKQIQRGNDLTAWFSKIITILANVFNRKQSTPFKKVHKNYNRPAAKTVSKIVTKDKTQQQIDDILDKISQSGYDSLSNAEKEFLFKSGKN